jgi:glucosamine-6-phosphate deaminase
MLGSGDQQLPALIYADARALGAALAEDILAGISHAARAGRRYLLGCPGGRSAASTYQALGTLVADQDADLSRLVIVMMDEYVIRTADGFVNCPARAHYSCHRFAVDDIVGVLNQGASPGKRIVPEHLWFPDPADPARYDVRIREAGGIDLFILASGASDGHVAFNPPGDPADSKTRIIALPESTRRDNMATFPDFTDIAEVPADGVSVGLSTIADLSREAVLIAHGADKQFAVRHLAAGAFDPQWPATVIYRCRGARCLFTSASCELLVTGC